MLFSDTFLDKPYRPAVLLQDPSAVPALFRYIDSTDRVTVDAVRAHAAYRNLLALYPHGKDVIDAQLAGIIAAKGKHANHPYRVVGGKIAYKRLDVWTSDWVYGYETAMAYLQEEKAGALSAQDADRHLYIHIPVGGFSYARVVQGFDLVLGVTGTLQLSDVQKATLEEQFRVERFFFLPSLYGASQLKVEDAVIAENKDRHHQALAEEAYDLTQMKRPVLIFFESEEALRRFTQSAEFRSKFGVNNAKVDVVTEEISKEDIAYMTQRATQQGQLTLLVRIFGRGQDFVVHDKKVVREFGGVHVIQTFLSVDPSEEVQVRGRTARSSNVGSYRLVLCYEDLQALVSSYEMVLDPSVPQSARVSGLPPALEVQRSAIHDKVVQLLLSKLGDTSAESLLHAKTLVLRGLLYPTSSGRKFRADLVLTELKQFSRVARGPSNATDVLYLLDISGSMQGYLEQAKEFLKKGALQGLGLATGMSSNRAGIITFHTQAFPVASGAEPLFTSDPAVLVQRVDRISGSGGTCFLPPLQAAEAQLAVLWNQEKPRCQQARRVLLFQTDGANSDVRSAIGAAARRIVNDLDTTIVAVLVGGGATPANVLNIVGHAGRYDEAERSVKALMDAGLIVSVEDYDALEDTAATITADASALAL